MKMLLASNGQFLINEGYKFLGIPKEQIRIGYITTASKKATDSGYIREYTRMMRNNGYKFEEIDIENKSRDELVDFFKDKNIIHMEGGNTFYLLKIIKKSGFDKIIKDLLNHGLIYVGTSAGSSVVGMTIELSSHIPKGAKQKELVALGLVPFLIKAHYTPNKRKEYQKRIKDIKYPVKFLMDGQGIFVDGNKCMLIGKKGKATTVS